MGRKVRRLAIGLAVAIVAGAGPALALPSATDTWLRVDTEHFTLLGNASQRRITAIGQNLERLREVLESTSTGMRMSSALPTTIFVFKNEASFAPYKAGADGKPRSLADRTQPHRDTTRGSQGIS